MRYKLSKLVELFGGELVGSDCEVTKIAPIHLADAEAVSFISDRRYRVLLNTTNAACIILAKKDIQYLENNRKIIVDNPYSYFAKVSNLFNPLPSFATNIDKTADVKNAIIGKDPYIEKHVVIGKSTIGDSCKLFASVVIGDSVVIGNNVTIYPNVVIYNNVSIGDDCVIDSGVVIGSSGFGNAKDENNHYHRIPQIGGVIINNNVEIGANTCIDGGTFEPTIIGTGVRIDNLVQIAHNVIIGDHTAIAALVGIAGNTKIGKYCMIGGAVGITGHLNIADYVNIGGGSLLAKDIKEPGLYSSSLSAINFRHWARITIHIKNLDKIHNIIKELQKNKNDI